MAQDIVPHSSGGSLTVSDGAGGALAHVGLPSRAAIAQQRQQVEQQAVATTDAQHFAAFESMLGKGMPAGVVKVVMREAQALVATISDDGPDNPFALLGDFVQRLMKAGINDPAALNRSIASAADYLIVMLQAQQEADELARYEVDELDRTNAQKVLKEQWGPDWKTTYKAVVDYVNNRLPVSFADAFHEGRDSEGHFVAYSPQVQFWLADLAGVGGSAAGGGAGTTREALEREAAEIRKKMPTREYLRSPTLQARYRELLALLQR